MVVVLPFLLLLLCPVDSHTKTTPKNFEAIAKDANAAREADRLIDAVRLYSEGVRLRPSWTEGWWWLGSVLYEQDRFSEAQTPFRRFIALSPKPEPAYAFLALCEYEARDYEHSLEHLQAWAKAGSPGNDALLDVAGFHWALLLVRAGRFNEALYLLAAKGKKLGASSPLIEAMGLASLRMAFLPQDYPPERREVVWLAGLAAYYFSAQSDAQRSEFYAQRLLTRYGQEPNVHYFRGTLFSFMGQYEAAVDEFKKELQISPDHPPALTEWAVCKIQSGAPAEALEPARRAVEVDPQAARAHYALGRALFETGSYQQSAQELEAAKRIAPQSSRIRFLLSNAYKHLGRAEDAQREQNAFLALKDKEEVFAPLDEKLKSGGEQGRPQ